MVSIVGFNDEIVIVIVGGFVNKLKDYKDIVNDVVESLDFFEFIDWEEFFSDYWLVYVLYGSIYEGIFLDDDCLFYYIYDYLMNCFGIWDII